jgi:HK97 family phage portal protein
MEQTGLLDQMRLKLASWLLGDRAFVLGPGAVDPSDTYFGRPSDEFTPAEYGNYIATSNGVYACATLRADLLSSLPLQVFKLKTNGDKVLVEKGNLFALLQKVNPFWTFNRLIQMTSMSLDLWGEAFWFLERGPSGKGLPREIWWGRPDRVRVVPDEKNYIKGFLYTPANGGEDIPFSPDEVIWFRYPNPIDEFEGLSPLAAARLAADVASAAMKSNRNVFSNGLQMGGAIFPKTGQNLTPEQAQELEKQLDKRFKGVDKAHRWGVFRFEVQMAQAGVSPKDAEFLGALKWSLEDICRAYKVPIDLVGGQRTYENYESAMRDVWQRAIKPLVRFIKTELIEQLLPIFPEADLIDFDFSEVDVLQEAQAQRWAREKEQLQVGVITVNEWRESQGLEPFAESDSNRVPLLDTVGGMQGAATILQYVALNYMTPESAVNLFVLFFSIPEERAKELVGDPSKLVPVVKPSPTDNSDDEDEESGDRSLRTRTIEYGSDEHKRVWNRFVRQTERFESQFAEVMRSLFRRQRDSVIDRLMQPKRTAEEAQGEPFDMAQWIKTFREEVRPVLVRLVQDVGQEALEDLGVSTSFDVNDPAVVRFLERRAQRFAKAVNDTTWDQLKDSLKEGIEAGESIAQLADRVESVMGVRIESSAETIARTEVIGASNGGMLEAWKQSDIVEGKVWIAAIDDRTRDSHIDAHERYADNPIPLDEDFEVGGCSGPAPGQMGCPEEDINCRCTMIAQIKERAIIPFPSGKHLKLVRAVA